jgi:hypothetical protein
VSKPASSVVDAVAQRLADRGSLIAVHDNFPEKKASMEESRTYNTLKIRDILLISFPKKLVSGEYVSPRALSS